MHRLAAGALLSLVLGALAVPGTARGQGPAPSTTPPQPAAPQGTPDTPPSTEAPSPAGDPARPPPAPAPLAPPAARASATPAAAQSSPAEPPRSVVVAGVPLRLTGIVHTTVIGSQGVQSFGLPTAVAATAALNPALANAPDDPVLSFQVQQTRLGVIVGEGTAFRGQVEVDFTHFEQSSPTTQAFPRLRIAVVEWRFAEDHKLFLGQTWDLFGNAAAPLVSHSFNLVGTLFQAGNVGFMRHQLGWSGRFDRIEIALATGLQGANAGPAFGDIERAFSPVGLARVMLHLGPRGVVGVSGLATALRFTRGTMIDHRLAAGGAAFADLDVGPLNLHTEAYVAQNLANTGVLNLGQGRFGSDVADAGGYVSGRLTLGAHAFTAMVGGAVVLDPDDVVPGYTPAAMNPPGASVAMPAAAAGPGMTHNASAHAGYWFSPLRGFSLVLEPYVYATRFVYAPTDRGRFSPDRVAFGAMVGSMYQF